MLIRLAIFDVDSLINTADSRLFRSMTFPDHCLHNLLPNKCNHTINLRPKAHNYTLPIFTQRYLRIRLSTEVF